MVSPERHQRHRPRRLPLLVVIAQLEDSSSPEPHRAKSTHRSQAPPDRALLQSPSRSPGSHLPCLVTCIASTRDQATGGESVGSTYHEPHGAGISGSHSVQLGPQRFARTAIRLVYRWNRRGSAQCLLQTGALERCARLRVDRQPSAAVAGGVYHDASRQSH